MRRLLPAAALAAAGLGLAVPSAPASASYSCHGVYSGESHAGVCAGSWCGDECYPVAYVECSGFNLRLCAAVDGLGATPPGATR